LPGGLIKRRNEITELTNDSDSHSFFELHQGTLWDNMNISNTGNSEMTKKKGINVKALTERLRSSQKTTIEKVLRELKDLSEPDQIAKVAEFLNDESWHFRSKIEDVLVAIGQDAVDILYNIITGSVWYVRANAISALGRIGIADPKVVKIAAELLEDSSTTVRKAAESAIMALLDENNISEILESVSTEYGSEIAQKILTLLSRKDKGLYHSFISKTE